MSRMLRYYIAEYTRGTTGEWEKKRWVSVMRKDHGNPFGGPRLSVWETSLVIPLGVSLSIKLKVHVDWFLWETSMVILLEIQFRQDSCITPCFDLLHITLQLLSSFPKESKRASQREAEYVLGSLCDQSQTSSWISGATPFLMSGTRSSLWETLKVVSLTAAIPTTEILPLW